QRRPRRQDRADGAQLQGDVRRRGQRRRQGREAGAGRLGRAVVGLMPLAASHPLRSRKRPSREVPTMNRLLASVLPAALVLAAPASPARGDALPAKYQEAISKGLDWLARQQFPDGHWEAQGGQYPVAMTGLGGMAFLMEGSTIREGKYQQQIRKAVDWFTR